jgi:hypothetical protein
MAPFNYLQPILGTDKRNLVFSILQHSQSKDFIRMMMVLRRDQFVSYIH